MKEQKKNKIEGLFLKELIQTYCEEHKDTYCNNFGLLKVENLIAYLDLNGYEYRPQELHYFVDRNDEFNPVLAVTKDTVTPAEKEIALKKFLLFIGDEAFTFSKQRLSDMSFLDDEPIWQERCSKLLQFFATYKD